MSSEFFSARPAPHWLLVTGLVIGPIVLGAAAWAFLLDPSWLTGYLCVLVAVLFASTVSAWRYRSRPLLKITDEEIRYASRDWLPARRVALREIESIEVSDERRAVIHLRSGRRLVVGLRYIDAPSRGRAVAALERAARTGSSLA